MRFVFADTSYWVAMIHPGDSVRAKALSASESLAGTTVVTTHEVLAKVLTFFSKAGLHARSTAAQAVRDALEDSNLLVVEQSEESFRSGLRLYEERLDKGYSHTDCVSMNVMRRLGIVRALTTDRHFQQEGFEILLRTEV